VKPRNSTLAGRTDGHLTGAANFHHERGRYPTAAPAAADDTRDETGRFLPGRTGNPRGRPVGSRRVLHLARALAEAGVVAVVMVDPRRSARPAATARRPRRLAA
jgi:hypothetical protein